MSRRSGNRSTVSLVRHFMRGCMSFFWVTFLLYLVNMVAYLVAPFFQQVFTDNIITRKNPEWFGPLITCYIVLFLLELGVWMSMNLLRRRHYTKMGLLSSSRLVLNILELPLLALDRFSTGELVARYSSITSISRTMDQFSIGLIFAVQSVISGILLMMYSWKLGMTVLISMSLLVLVMQLSARNMKKKAKGTEVTDAHLQGVTMTGIKNIETIKSMGGERAFFGQWEASFVQALNVRVRSTMNMMGIGAIPLLVLQLSNALILCLGAWYILQGELTPGMLLASQSLAASIIYPVSTTVKATQGIYRSQAAMERLEEVEKACEGHRSLELPRMEELPEQTKLRGGIQLRNVTFGYDRQLPPVLDNLSMTIKAGERVAFVGFSGCGKSTIAKLISGLYEPWEGEILLDGVPLRDVNRAVMNNSLSVVNQDIVLFEGTVADNIKMWDDSIEDFSMVMAASDAQIHQDIAERPGAYQSPMAENGKNFSGGQRQRIEIATALAKDPSILIMDEGTSALDPKTEQAVMRHIRGLGITMVLIAHRLSTIRDCDCIYVMDKGRILQQGTHEQLMQQEGLYRELMKYA